MLANKLGITDAAEMAEAELLLLEQLYEAVLVAELPLRQLTVADLFSWHRRWLGNVYPFAGLQRGVNASKDGFMFAAAAQVPRLLEEFERDCLARYTPALIGDRTRLVQAIAETHAELILIHPFVEGNGRLARLLADVMAVQAGHEPLDYSDWDARREDYFAAIRAALGRDYSGLQQLVDTALGAA
nr:Fic family protein [Nevskia sp.]